MDHPVEVASFHRGELQSVRLLSPRDERRAMWVATAVVGGILAGAMVASLAVARAAGLVLHAPTFFASWAAVAGGVGMVAVRRVRDRVRRYRIGAAVDADAFAPIEADLVRRVGRAGYQLQLAPGMSGVVETTSASVPIEALIEERRATAVPIPSDGAARVDVGAHTFVIRRAIAEPLRIGGVAAAPGPVASSLDTLARATVGKLSRFAAGGIPIAVLATLLGSTPQAMAVGDVHARPAVPVVASAWQAKVMLRDQAQLQAATLHRCFDAMPLECQRSGQVGVGVELDPLGAVKAHWVARSSYGYECPVGACVEDVVAGWTFDPAAARSKRFVLPIEIVSRRENGGNPSQIVVIPVSYRR